MSRAGDPRIAVMLKRLSAPVTLLLLALAVGGCGGSTSHAEHGSEFNGDTHFKLPNASRQQLPAWGPGVSGEVLPIRPRKGRLMVLFFGFTSCPDVCPTTLAATGAAVRLLPKEQQKQVEGAMVTVDPARDSGPKLKKYIGRFFARETAWGFRTDDAAELKKVERAFGASSEIAHEHEGGGHSDHRSGDYDVGHSSFRYAIDAQGKVVLMWQESATSEQVAEDLSRLLKGDERPGV